MLCLVKCVLRPELLPCHPTSAVCWNKASGNHEVPVYQGVRLSLTHFCSIAGLFFQLESQKIQTSLHSSRETTRKSVSLVGGLSLHGTDCPPLVVCAVNFQLHELCFGSPGKQKRQRDHLGCLEINLTFSHLKRHLVQVLIIL